MPLTGSYARSLDEKLRVAIPKRLRDSGLGKTVYFAPGTDGSLALYGEEAFGRLANRLATASPAQRDVRAFARLFYAQSQQAEIDSQGRLRIPPELATLAGVEKDVVLLGVGDHLEIWSAARWNTYLAEKQAHYDEIAEQALSASS